MRRILFLLFFSAVLLSSRLYSQSSCSAISLGRGASLNGFIPFPADNAWEETYIEALEATGQKDEAQRLRWSCQER